MIQHGGEAWLIHDAASLSPTLPHSYTCLANHLALALPHSYTCTFRHCARPRSSYTVSHDSDAAFRHVTFHSWRILFRRRSRASMRAPLSRKGRPTLHCLHIHSAVTTMVRKTLWSDVLVLPHTNLCSLLPRGNKWMALPELCRYKRQDPSTCCPGSLNALLSWRSSSSPSEEDELDEPSSESLDAASLWGSTSLPLAGSRGAPASLAS